MKFGSHKSLRWVWGGLIGCCVACSDSPRPEALEPDANMSPRQASEAEPTNLVRWIDEREISLPEDKPQPEDVVFAEDSLREVVREGFYALDSGSPFSLLEPGEMSDVLPTKKNFTYILGASDDVSSTAAAALWERGDTREAFEICMHLAAASEFARGYQGREVARYRAQKQSVPLAEEFAPVGTYLRTHVRDRVGFEGALDLAHELSQKELWVREGVLEDSTQFSDWCAKLHAVFEDTSTQVYEQGIEPYLLD